jgi:hypothetical protein
LADARENWEPVARFSDGEQTMVVTRALVQAELEERDARLEDGEPWNRYDWEPQYAEDLLPPDDSTEYNEVLKALAAAPAARWSDFLGPVKERWPIDDISQLGDPGIYRGGIR